MAASLPNSTSPSWNISKEDQDDAFTPNASQNLNYQSPRTRAMFPMQSFSSLGGGDAPLLPNMSRVRSQLFTISTRAVISSHSQMSVNYTTGTSTSSGGEISADHTVHHHYSSSSSSVSVDSDIEEYAIADVKPLNTDILGGAAPVAAIACKPVEDLEEADFKAERNNALSRSKRCIHGSFEDLLATGEKKKVTNDRRKSCPVPSTSSTRSQMVQAANDLLAEENRRLVQRIQNLRRRLIVSKVATLFTLEAVKKRGKVIKALEAKCRDKKRQCAARLILHSLLLNSWRNTKRELDMRLADNADLRKSVENFSLQVQVLRHVQTGERQKAQEKAAIIKDLGEELKVTREENSVMRKEMEKMENELNSLQASTQNIFDENKVLSAEITKLMDMKDKLTQSLEWEKHRAEQFSKENGAMKESLKKLEVQLKEASEQRNHWQERARCSESETWELQLHLESKTGSIQELTTACQALREEKQKLIDLKSQLKSSLDRSTVALRTLSEKNDELMETYEGVKAERDAKAERILEMERTLATTKRDFTEIERELLSYKLQNVRKRREWGNALYFVVSPMEAVRRKLL